MSGFINTNNNIDSSNGVITSIGTGSDDSGSTNNNTAVQNAKDSINNLTGAIKSNSSSAQANNSPGVSSGYISTSSRRKSSASRSASQSGASQQRYISSNKPRPSASSSQSSPSAGYVKGKNVSSRSKKDKTETKKMTAKTHYFKKRDNNKYAYNKYLGGNGGQEISKDSALDSLLFSDIANTMIDNGFTLDRDQRDSISNYEHEFSDNFAEYEDVHSDLLYQQAAIVDALLSNGAFLTPQQEIELGIPDGLTGNP